MLARTPLDVALYVHCLSCFHLSLTQYDLEIGGLLSNIFIAYFPQALEGILFETLLIVVIFYVCPLICTNTQIHSLKSRERLTVYEVCMLVCPVLQAQETDLVRFAVIP